MLHTITLETMTSFLRFFNEEDRNRETRPQRSESPGSPMESMGCGARRTAQPLRPPPYSAGAIEAAKASTLLGEDAPKKRFLRHWRVGADSTKGCGRLAGKGGHASDESIL